MDRPVLAVIDVQNGFVTERSAHVVPVIRDLVDRWQRAGRDTVFTRYFNYPGSPYERLIGWSEVMGPPATDIVSELQPLVDAATAVVDKRTYSLLASDGGRDLVARHGWTDLYVCGIDTEICVLKTAVDAFEQNLTPWIIEDASASHSGEHLHEAGLLLAERFIGVGQVIKAADVSVLLGERDVRRVTCAT